MIKQELLRGKTVQVNMYNVNKNINSKAVFNQKDVKTAVIMCQLKLDTVLNLSGCSVSAEILKPDGKTVVQKAQIMDAENGIVAVGLTEQCLSAIGVAQCELVIQSESQVLYSPKISYIVVDNLFDVEGVESSNELPVLNALIAEVLQVQNELTNLDATITSNESTRNIQEEIRETNEQNRVESMENIEENFEQIVSKNNDKIKEVDLEIKKSQESTLVQVGKIDDKINEINERMTFIDETFENIKNNANSTINKEVEKVTLKINEVNLMMQEADKTLDNIVKEFNLKLANVDDSVANKFNEVDKTLNTKLLQVQSQVNDRLSGYDAKVVEVNKKITEVDTAVNNKITEINNVKNTLTKNVNDKITEIDTTKTNLVNSVNTKIQEVNNKVSGYETKVNEVNSLISNVQNAETSRNQAEIARQNTFNDIVKELEVTQTDIDEILGMIGGL